MDQKLRQLKPPSLIIIDPINICNLKCALCATDKLKYPKMRMTFDTFKIVVDKMPFAEKIELFNWGEPFLNHEIFLMIEYARKKDIVVSIHSNFSLKRDKNFFYNMIKSGLNTLTLSIDGASQDSYSKYRRGGDFNLILSNIERLVEAKKELKSEAPEITWKYLVNRYNENEIDKAIAIAKNLGIQFHAGGIGIGDDAPDLVYETSVEQRKDQWLPKNNDYVLERYQEKYKLPLFGRSCDIILSQIVINPDGKIFPCCLLTDEKNVFGDLVNESFEDIWDNFKYRYSRSLFTNVEYNGPQVESICAKCNNFQYKEG